MKSNENVLAGAVGKLIGSAIGLALGGLYIVAFAPGIFISAFSSRNEASRKHSWILVRWAVGIVFIPILVTTLIDFREAHTVHSKLWHINLSAFGWAAVSAKVFSPHMLVEYGTLYLFLAYVAFQLVAVAPICMLFGVASMRGFDRLRFQLKQEAAPGSPEIKLPRPGLIGRLRQRGKVEIEKGYVTLGRSETTGHIVRLGGERTMHMQIVGSSGVGKTESIKRIVESDIADGRPVIWIDGKGDLKNAAWFASTVALYGKEEHARYFLPEQKHGTYNPFGYGSPTELKDRLMSAMVWSEEYYKDRAEEVLQVVLNALCSVPEKSFTLEDVAEALDAKGNGLPHLIAGCDDARAKRHLSRFARDKEWQEAVSGLRAKLNSFVISDYGDMLTGKDNPVSLWRAYEKRRPVYISLPVGSAPQIMPRFGKMLLADLNSLNSALATGKIANNGVGCSVIIDEFSNFVSELFTSFLSTARSQGFMVTIAHQSLGDLEKFDPAIRKQILGNTNIKLIFKQDAPEDAEMWAKLIGTRKAFEKTRQVEEGLFGDNGTGLGSMKEIEEFIAHPNIIKGLPTGYGVFVRKEPRLITPIGCSEPTKFPDETRWDALNKQLENERVEKSKNQDWSLASAKKESLAAPVPAKKENHPAPPATTRPEVNKSPISPAAQASVDQEQERRPVADNLTHGGEW